jgi:hypothetical protein
MFLVLTSSKFFVGLLPYTYVKIFAIASPHADLPAELIERVSGSGIAMVSKWCPQQKIFSHPVRQYYPVVITSELHFSIGYRLVFKSLWTQQCYRSFVARYTNVGNLLV